MNRKALKLNQGDIEITNNKIELVEGREEVKQSITERVELAKGEWFLDLERGMDTEPMKTKRYQLELIEISVIEAIKQDPRIDQVNIKEIKVNKNRLLTIKADVTVAEYGIIDIEI